MMEKHSGLTTCKLGRHKGRDGGKTPLTSLWNPGERFQFRFSRLTFLGISLRVQSQQLATESKVFEDEVRPATERTEQPAEEMPERHDHGKNFSGKDRIKLRAKSLISQVYDLLARHSRPNGIHPAPTERTSAGYTRRALSGRFQGRIRQTRGGNSACGTSHTSEPHRDGGKEANEPGWAASK
jgi:hypothetical protein